MRSVATRAQHLACVAGTALKAVARLWLLDVVGDAAGDILLGANLFPAADVIFGGLQLVTRIRSPLPLHVILRDVETWYGSLDIFRTFDQVLS